MKFVALPAKCFDHVPLAVVSQGATNEDVAHAYRDNLDATIAGNVRLDECYELNGSDVQ